MNPMMFYKLVERKLVTVGMDIGVEYDQYDLDSNIKKMKGVYQINHIGVHPLGFGLELSVSNDSDITSITMQDVKMIGGMTPIKFAASHGVRPDGKTEDAPKRRGRKPKIRNPEIEWAMDDEEAEELEA